MLKVQNNDVYISRGHTGGLDIQHWNLDGTPFILPPVPKKSIHSIAHITFDGYAYHYNFFEAIAFTKIEFTKNIDYIDIYNIDGHVRKRISGNSCENIEKCGAIVVPDGARIKHAKFTNEIAVGEVCDKGILSVASLNVKVGTTIKLQLYANLTDAISSNGVTDRTFFGFNKFTSYDIVDSEDTTFLLKELQDKLAAENNCLGRVDNDFYQLAAVDKDYYVEQKLLPYKFAFTIPLLFDYISEIAPQEYTYDIIVYQGIPKDIITDEFPLETVLWKSELLTPHKFIIGDSNNV